MIKKKHIETQLKPWYERRILYGKQQNEIIVTYNVVLFGFIRIPIPISHHFYTDSDRITSDQIKSFEKEALE